MKKGLIITGTVLAIIILSLIILPVVFKGKIIEVVKKEANKMLNATMDFDNVSLSFIRSFPDATVTLNDFYLAGINEFEGDTLIAAGSASATINLKSLFGDSGYEISKVNLTNGKINAKVLENGKANWDIMKSDSPVTEEPDSSDSDFRLVLQKVTIENTSVFYKDEVSDMQLGLSGINAKLSGDMTADNTQIETSFDIDDLSFIMDKIPYLSKAKINADIKLDADLKNMVFILSDNKIRLNEITASIDGQIALPDDESVEMDIRLNTPQIQFKDILSLIPAIYSNEFKDINTSGEVSLNAVAKGVMKGELLPSFNVKLDVANATFQYPALPKSVNSIGVLTQISNPGGTADKTVIDISKLHFEMGGNPFDLTLHLSNPVSDPNMALSAVGHLDLGMIKEVYPLEDMKLDGKLNADLKIKTRMSYIDKEEYEKVDAAGTLILTGMSVQGKDMEDIQINNASLSFSPQFVNLQNFSAQIGKNDVSGSGKLENLLPYALKDETLKGTLSVTSNFLNLNDFMKDSESAGESDTAAISVIPIPKNLDFNLNGTFKKVLFDNFDMENVTGQLLVRNGKVEMKNLNMNALGGSIGVNGYYDTSNDPNRPDVSFDLKINNASFAQTFSSFTTVQKLAPLFEFISGNFSTSFNMTTPLGSDFMPILASLSAGGLLQSSGVEVKNAPILNALSSSLKNEELKELKIKDLKLPFSIDNGKVTTKPFDINFGQGNKMSLSGSTGLDQSIDYTAKVNLAEKLTQGYVKSIDLKIGGTFNSPKISIDSKDLAEQAINKLAESVIGKDSVPLSQKINAEVEKQAENIRKQAKDAGNKLIEESEKQGNKLIEEANKVKNPLAKAAAVKAAEAAAQKAKSEAAQKADDLNKEAEKQIQSIMEKASQQGK